MYNLLQKVVFYTGVRKLHLCGLYGLSLFPMAITSKYLFDALFTIEHLQPYSFPVLYTA